MRTTFGPLRIKTYEANDFVKGICYLSVRERELPKMLPQNQFDNTL
jgi:hypothetical protein